MAQLHQEGGGGGEFGHQRLPKKPRQLDCETPPPLQHFPHNQNLPPKYPHFPMLSQHQHGGEELGQPLAKKPRLGGYEAPPPMNHHRPQNGGGGGGGSGRLFYKTRICFMFMQGCCRHGDNCTYAHGQSDLRKPPPNWEEIGRNTQNGMTMANTNYGSFGRAAAACLGSSGDAANNVITCDDQKMQNLLKTKLCYTFQNTGGCPYGNGCSYAHGIAELRNLNNMRGGVVESKSRANVGGAAPPPPPPPTGRPTIPGGGLMSAAAAALPMEPQTTCYMEEDTEEEVGRQRRWPKKMNGIYGDWPSYLTLRRGC